MSIVSGQTISTGDFKNTSAGSGDASKVPQLASDGKLDRSFIRGAYGGNGSDSSLSISSGTTTLDVGAAQTYIKNHTTISITGTGALAFTNPYSAGTFIFYRATGNVTLTSSATALIDVTAMGAQYGTDGASNLGPTKAGGDGHGGTTNYSAPGGTAPIKSPFYDHPYARGRILWTGAGGGQPGNGNGATSSRGTGGAGGSSGINNGGNGGSFGSEVSGWPGGTNGTAGRGGGCFSLECGGAFNGTGTIYAKGQDGTASSQSNSTAGGGGGGGGGRIDLSWNTLTANTMTLTVTGGSGGAASWGLGGGSGGDGLASAYKNDYQA